HCGHLWNASLPLQKKVRFVWIPVGLINPTSSAQGATLLSAADPAQAMSEHETSLLAKQGGIGTSSSVTDEAKQAVAANTALFNNLGLEGVPFTIVKNARTGQPVTRGGSMETPMLAELIGIDAP
ncbi:MAG: DsbC family protein, partial [Rhodoferax sp.]|nr:DsbC family protein [Rhodoferax sp.]